MAESIMIALFIMRLVLFDWATKSMRTTKLQFTI